MKILLFGATGMVGQGVLHECVLDADVGRAMLIVARRGAPKRILESVDIDALR